MAHHGPKPKRDPEASLGIVHDGGQEQEGPGVFKIEEGLMDWVPLQDNTIIVSCMQWLLLVQGTIALVHGVSANKS